MEAITEAVKIILGEKPNGYYLAGFFFSFLSILLSMYIHSKKRNVNSPYTPDKFSWWFLVADNLKRIFASLIVMFILFRLFDLSNAAAMIGVGFFVGGGLDTAIEFIMKRTNLLDILKPIHKDNDSEPV